MHVTLSNALKLAETIELYTLVLPQSETVKWRGLPIHLLLGSKAGLIEEMHPDWNRRGRAAVARVDG